MNEIFDIYFLACFYLLLGMIVGVLMEVLLMSRLKKMAERTKWKGDDFLIQLLKGMLFFWSTFIGAYFALRHLKINNIFVFASDKFVFAAVVFSLTILVSNAVMKLVKLKTKESAGLLPSTSIITNVIRITIFLIGGLIILQTLGISIAPLLTALGVGGLAVALALQDTLSNLFAGIQIIASQQVRTGDYVKLESGEEGYVADITWRSTSIRMLSNNLVIVPNSKIASAIFINYHLPDKEMAVLVEVGVSYDSDLVIVEQVTTETAKEIIGAIEGKMKGFEPFIRYHTFGDSSINFTVILRASEFANQYVIKHEFIKALHKSYAKHNIEIPFPIRTVYLKDYTLN